MDRFGSCTARQTTGPPSSRVKRMARGSGGRGRMSNCSRTLVLPTASICPGRDSASPPTVALGRAG
jgi:hypothetical protein